MEDSKKIVISLSEIKSELKELTEQIKILNRLYFTYLVGKPGQFKLLTEEDLERYL